MKRKTDEEWAWTFLHRWEEKQEPILDVLVWLIQRIRAETRKEERKL